MGDSVQEMSFQNVVDTILTPEGIKVGGYPDNIFINLAEADREKWQCNIWLVLLTVGHTVAGDYTGNLPVVTESIN